MKTVIITNLNQPHTPTIPADYCSSFLCHLRGLMFRQSISSGAGLLLVQKKEDKINATIHMMFMDTKASKAFLEWVKGRPPDQTIHKFSLWWYENDWGGKQGQPPSIQQIQELWPQAFKAPPPKEFNSARRKQAEAAAEIERQLAELAAKGAVQ